MSSEEFNALMAGLMSHPRPAARINRLSLALQCVVSATGEAGERALREHCAARAEKDKKDLEECG